VRRAHDLRIETVHQGQTLGEKQPLWRNLFVGRQIVGRFGFIDVAKEKEIADRLLRQAIGFRGEGITAESTVRELSGGERQGIAIARAMYFEADLIVLDEPTAALAVSEVRKVLSFVEGVKSAGGACIYIEHNLAHVHEVADRLVILDRGRVVGEFAKGEIGLPELTAQMIALHEGRTHA
jgi:simple sugar transport system ATP-binding protein